MNDKSIIRGGVTVMVSFALAVGIANRALHFLLDPPVRHSPPVEEVAIQSLQPTAFRQAHREAPQPFSAPSAITMPYKATAASPAETTVSAENDKEISPENGCKKWHKAQDTQLSAYDRFLLLSDIETFANVTVTLNGTPKGFRLFTEWKNPEKQLKEYLCKGTALLRDFAKLKRELVTQADRKLQTDFSLALSSSGLALPILQKIAELGTVPDDKLIEFGMVARKHDAPMHWRAIQSATTAEAAYAAFKSLDNVLRSDGARGSLTGTLWDIPERNFPEFAGVEKYQVLNRYQETLQEVFASTLMRATTTSNQGQQIKAIDEISAIVASMDPARAPSYEHTLYSTKVSLGLASLTIP